MCIFTINFRIKIKNLQDKIESLDVDFLTEPQSIILYLSLELKIN